MAAGRSLDAELRAGLRSLIDERARQALVEERVLEQWQPSMPDEDASSSLFVEQKIPPTRERLAAVTQEVDVSEVPAVINGVELSLRERQVVALVADGLSAAQIACVLVISKNTVREHISNLRRKTGAKRTEHLVALMFREHLMALAFSVKPSLVGVAAERAAL